MGVAYNKRTGKYVLVSQYSHRTNVGILFATSDSPTGRFTYATSQEQIENTASPGNGDQTLFVDDDGQAYLTFSSTNAKNRRTLYVAWLRPSEFLAIEPAVKIHDAPGAGREGNAVFKHKGRYFASSDLHGWNASRSFYVTAEKVTGPYSAEKMMEGSELDFSHVSQNGFFIPVHGTAPTTIIYAGDRWSDFAGNGIGYNVWVPLSFNGADVKFNSLSQWRLAVAKGT